MLTLATIAGNLQEALPLQITNSEEHPSLPPLNTWHHVAFRIVEGQTPCLCDVIRRIVDTLEQHGYCVDDQHSRDGMLHFREKKQVEKPNPYSLNVTMMLVRSGGYMKISIFNAGKPYAELG